MRVCECESARKCKGGCESVSVRECESVGDCEGVWECDGEGVE